MKFLFCCEFYYPSVGGVQEVIKQISERLVARGHEVTVATSALPNRDFTSLNGVHIEEFSVSGNLVRGMQGEIERYREFVRTFPFDTLLIKAAQQWTFDALWSDFDQITARKVFIPCGFSGLYERRYEAYFKYLPAILKKFNALIFYADDYRDINYARKHHIPNCIVLSNGASEKEFEVPLDPHFRTRHGIAENSFLILTVGSLTGAKGHLELAKAVSLLPGNESDITLLLNGNDPFPEPEVEGGFSTKTGVSNLIRGWVLSCSKFIGLWFDGVIFLLRNITHPFRLLNAIKALFFSNRNANLSSEYSNFDRVNEYVSLINSSNTSKRALLLDLPRDELVQAYLNADLFVFASHVEYSPLVLFESAAAGTPFLSSGAGNANEIIKWLGGGFLMKDCADSEGFRVIDPQDLADEIAVLMNQRPLLQEVGKIIHENWQRDFTWDHIAERYEAILMGAK